MMKRGISHAASGIGFLFAIAITACSPEAPPSVANAPKSIPASQPHPPPAAPPPWEGHVGQAPRYATTRHAGITFRGVAFDSRGHRLRVVDQPDGPGSSFGDAAAVGRSLNALFVANGGFFTPEGSPLGLVVSEGLVSGAWNAASSLGSAIWQEDQTGRSVIVRRNSTSSNQAVTMRNLLQAGPLLIEHGRPVGGLENQKHSARTFLLWDGGYRWWLGISSPATLATLSGTLANHPPVPWRPAMALNLDGGRSSELWVSRALSHQETHFRPPWNRPVRNFLALVPRG